MKTLALKPSLGFLQPFQDDFWKVSNFNCLSKKGMEIVIERRIKTGIEIVMYGLIQEGIETWDTKKNEEDMKRD